MKISDTVMAMRPIRIVMNAEHMMIAVWIVTMIQTVAIIKFMRILIAAEKLVAASDRKTCRGMKCANAMLLHY